MLKKIEWEFKMLRNIKTQISILIRQKSANYCFLLMLAAVFINYIYNLISLRGVDAGDIPNYLYFSVLSNDNPFGWYILTFFAFLIAMPGGFSLAKEKHTKMNLQLITRYGSRLRYYSGKIVAVMFVTFICFFIPLVVELILNLVAFPRNSAANMVDIRIAFDTEVNYLDNGFMYGVFQRTPHIYAIVKILYTSFVASLLSLVPLAFSCIYAKYYTYLFLPLYFMLAFYQGSVFEIFGYYPNHNYLGYFWWGLMKNNRTDYIYFTGLVIFVALVSAIVIIVNSIVGGLENETV